VGQDLRELKVTLPLIGALKVASVAAKSEMKDFFKGTEHTDEEISRIVELVREMGGVEYAKSKAKEFAGTAEEALGGLPEGPALRSLRDSITYVVDRNR
jgi:octaprenyl-diphosphate synthase